MVPGDELSCTLPGVSHWVLFALGLLPSKWVSAEAIGEATMAAAAPAATNGAMKRIVLRMLTPSKDTALRSPGTFPMRQMQCITAITVADQDHSTAVAVPHALLWAAYYCSYGGRPVMRPAAWGHWWPVIPRFAGSAVPDRGPPVR